MNFTKSETQISKKDLKEFKDAHKKILNKQDKKHLMINKDKKEQAILKTYKLIKHSESNSIIQTIKHQKVYTAVFLKELYSIKIV